MAKAVTPKKPRGPKRSVTLLLRLTRQERVTLRLRATEQNTTVSAILRRDAALPD